MTTGEEFEISGLQIPANLLTAIGQGRWSRMAKSEMLEEIFGARPIRAKFFSLDGIVAVNRNWTPERDPLYIGEPNEAHPPGNIDPARSLIIAELGPDQLIALDYRGPGAPTIVYASDDVRSPWRFVADSIEDLLTMLDVE